MIRQKNSVNNILYQNNDFWAEMPDLKGAACYDNGIDPEAYFPLRRKSSRINMIAKRICTSCEVQEKCLKYALDNPEVQGIWGGTTQKERSVIRVNRLKNVG